MTLEEFAERGELDLVRKDWGALLFGDMGYCEALWISPDGLTIRWWSDIDAEWDPEAPNREPDRTAFSLTELATAIAKGEEE